MKAHINQQAARPLALLYGLPESTETGRGVRAALEEQAFHPRRSRRSSCSSRWALWRAWAGKPLRFTVGKRRTRSSSS